MGGGKDKEKQPKPKWDQQSWDDYEPRGYWTQGPKGSGRGNYIIPPPTSQESILAFATKVDEAREFQSYKREKEEEASAHVRICPHLFVRYKQKQPVLYAYKHLFLFVPYKIT